MSLFDSDQMEDGVEKILEHVTGAFDKIKNLATTADVSPFTAFVRALKTKDVSEINQLVKNGFDLNSADADGDRALHHAARMGNVSLLELLLELGANPKLGQEGRPEFLPIDEAIAFGHAEAAETIARHGGYPDTNHTDRKLGALHTACEKGKRRVVRSLLQAGVNPNEETPNGSTPLLVATFRAEADVALELLNNNDVRRFINIKNNHTDSLARNAFQIAAEKGMAVVVQEMLEVGADPNKTASNGMTAFDFALNAGQFETACLLAASNMDLNRSKAPASLPLHSACATTALRHAEKKARLVEELLRHGADPDKIDPVTGSTPLILALQSTDGAQAFVTLLRMGANPALRTRSGDAPLQIAIEMKNTQAEKLLRQALHNQTKERKTSGPQSP